MKTVWKFPLEAPSVSVRIPEKGAIVHVGFDRLSGHVALWAIVESTAPREEREFRVLATGEQIPEITYTEKLKVQAMGQSEEIEIEGAERKILPLFIGTAIIPPLNDDGSILGAMGLPTPPAQLVVHVFEIIKR